MGENHNAPRVAVFEPFHFDLVSRELRKNGIRLRLEEKPALVLEHLIGNAGTIMTRGALQKLLWPDGVYVDFDHGLNKAINRLRAVLGDDRDQPRYIETLSRRGYRFIAAVEFAPNGHSAVPMAVASADASLATQVPHTSVTSLTDLAAPSASFSKRSAVLAFLTILLAATGAYFAMTAVASKSLFPFGPVRLAVLPFRNLTGDPGQEYICDGLTEELISQLSMLNADRLGVIARTSVMHYKGSSETARQIGSELTADYILEGSVRSVGGQYRVTTQLIDTHSETPRWTESFDRELKDIADVHRDVALAVGHEIGFHVVPQFQMPATGTQPINPEAHDYYLRGRYRWNKRTVTDLRAAIDDFDRAITAQPSYAEGYSGLADAYSLLASFGGAPYREAYPKARDAALKSLALERTAQALTSLAFVEAFYDWKVVKAEDDFRAAIQLNPNYATAHHWYGLFLNLRGRHANSIAQLLEASRLDPLSIAINGDLANSYVDAGRYEEAAAELKKLREREPDHFGSYRGLAILCAAQHRFPEAETANVEFKKRSGSYLGIEYILAYRYAEAGETERAKAVVQNMLRQSKLHGDRPPCALDAYLVLRDDDAALDCLVQAIAERGDWVISFQVNPRMTRVLNDPRFHSELERAGLLSDLH